MSVDPDLPERRRRFTNRSGERFSAWAEPASAEDFGLVAEAFMCVVEGTWRGRYPTWQDVTHRLTFHLHVRPGLLVSVRFASEYPDMAQLIYIGPP